jgi:hypothetical protein
MIAEVSLLGMLVKSYSLKLIVTKGDAVHSKDNATGGVYGRRQNDPG